MLDPFDDVEERVDLDEEEQKPSWWSQNWWEVLKAVAILIVIAIPILLFISGAKVAALGVMAFYAFMTLIGTMFALLAFG